ncbi:7178_t:CDS:2, partial [Scutellospora calospora]
LKIIIQIQAMSFDNENLATPIIKWLGLHCADWQKYNISKNTLLPLTSADRKKLINYFNVNIFNMNGGTQVLFSTMKKKYLSINLNNIDYRDKICRMLYMAKKAEMQSLCENGDIINYLIMKFENLDSWL